MVQGIRLTDWLQAVGSRCRQRYHYETLGAQDPRVQEINQERSACEAPMSMPRRSWRPQSLTAMAALTATG